MLNEMIHDPESQQQLLRTLIGNEQPTAALAVLEAAHDIPAEFLSSRSAAVPTGGLLQVGETT